MNLEQLEKSGMIIYKVIAGSHCYGTNNEDSDVDIRGTFILPNEDYLGLSNPPQQVSDETNDITYYSLKRMFELIIPANPNMIELLFLPEDCILECHPIMQKLIENRELFISTKAYHTFSGYSIAQIKRSKGQNKWINNPQPETPPDRLDFCWVIPVDRIPEGIFHIESVVGVDGKVKAIGQFRNGDTMPFRPIPFNALKMDLSKYHCAGLEHVSHVFRLYDYSDLNPKGVFRGEHQQLVVESIPFDDEWERYAGLLIYDESNYEKAKKDWKNYWTWKKERNEARYRSQEAGDIDFDAKNMLHCMRLLWSGKNILENGEPIVRFEGEQLQILKDIRAGIFSYEEIMGWVEGEMADLDKLKETSSIPHSVNQKAIDKLYQELIHMDR